MSKSIYLVMEDDRYPDCACSNRQYPKIAFTNKEKAKEYIKKLEAEERAELEKYNCTWRSWDYWNIETITLED